MNFILARLGLSTEIMGDIGAVVVLLVVLGLMSLICYLAFFAPLAREHAESEKVRTRSRRN
ncbi:hypothetical protein [Ralstonia pseudosolanacearum]|jgi:hypothetical protein|uniref:hypothetical protein n=1 Tax=Ralstonia pseudosolanacearum TaxID=1310165 RepID=UPI001FFBBDA5|nr:hypothetical protein [Ralstonia pseudosolanacearum]